VSLFDRDPARPYPRVTLTSTSNGLLVSDTEPRLRGDTPDPVAWDVAGGALRLPPRAAPYLNRLREALARYASGTAPDGLQSAFAAASGVVTSVGSGPSGRRPDLEEMRWLARALPEFGAFLSCAADEAERIVAAGTAGLWRALGLRSAPPAWTAEEREAARMLFACACAPSPETNPARLRTGLRSLAADRIAQRLTAELVAGEEVWMIALADRYASVRHRCAPRTAWRSRGLSDLLRADEMSRRAVAGRLEQWLIGGGNLGGLTAELEAALVHARTPARFA
jgi:hypothetical protein